MVQNLLSANNADYVRTLSARVLRGMKHKTPTNQLALGTVLGAIVAYPSVRIARAMALFSGGIILAVAMKNKCDCYLDLSKYNQMDFGSIIEYIKRNGSLSVGLTAGYLIGFAFA